LHRSQFLDLTKVFLKMLQQI